MKGSRWYIIFPVALIFIALSDLYLLLFTGEAAYENERLQQYYGISSMMSSLLFLILNALIAYIVYTYKEGRALIVIHILYIVLILGSLNAGSGRDPMGQLFNFLMQITLDISGVVYATKIRNAKLAFWLKTFLIAVLVETLLGIVLSIFLDPKTNAVVDCIISIAIVSILALFFWNLPSISMAHDEDDKGPDDLLSKKDLW